MKLLSVDTSTEVCSVCISDGGRISAEYVTRSSITHTERLLPAIQFLFAHLDWKIEDLDGLAVVNGPGSFTGLRISLSAVKGLSYAFNLPIYAGNALEVAARQIALPGWICPAMDARRGQIFTALFRREEAKIERITEPQSITPEEWVRRLPAEPVYFCGPGAALYFDSLNNNEGSLLLFQDFILARTLAVMAETGFQRGEILTGGQLKAAYLRPSDAETKGPRPARRLNTPRR